ncbi:DUF7507 domain-containing protein, partial [Echinicola shivajiensis]|uniref:DUF7507 domain-containing protein n=1 Tax=Echinicola shivajiensis TaxID=1035916 RepID=UPI001BFC2BEE
VTNTGNVSLTGVSVADAFAGGATLESGDADNDGELDLTEAWEYSASYDATQADIDAGADLVNTAIVSSNESGNAQDDATTTITQTPGIAIEKVVDVADISSPTTLNYTITVTNTGNVSLTGVSVADAFAGGATFVGGDTDNDGELDLTEAWEYSASYDATQADIDAGADLVNTAIVSSNETADAQDNATTTITQSPAFTVNKIVDLGNINTPSTLAYTIEIVNTGNISLNNVSPVDVMPGGGSGDLGTPTESVNANGILEVGEKWTYAAEYNVTQSDIDKGNPLVNTVTVTVDELGNPISDDALTTITQSAGIAIEKAVDVEEISAPTTLNYTITVTNTGNVSLTDVIVADEFAGGATLVSGDTDNDGEIDLTETWEYSATYEVTQADIDAGADLVNTAIVSSNETGDAQDDATTTITQSAGIAIEKIVDDANINAPTTLTYTITITNTGNVSLTGVSVVDEFAGGATFVGGDADNDGELDLAEAWEYSATYEATQADIDAGADLINTAIVSSNETAEAQDDAITTITQSAGIAIEKVVDVAEISAPAILNYTITVTNTGNVSLTGVSVVDEFAGGATFVGGDTDNDGELDLTEAWEYSASYEATQVDIDAGSDLVNVAVVSSNETADAQDDAVTMIVQSAAIDLIKTADKDSFSELGELITYTLTVTNTGNVSLSDVVVTDPLTGMDENVGGLMPNEEKELITTYVITQEDLDAGMLTNMASVTADAPAGGEEGDSDEVTIDADQTPGIHLDKVAISENFDEVGDVLDYEIHVTNTGNVTLSNIIIVDPLTGLVHNVASLAPGVIVTVNTSYTVTQEDLDRGFVNNQASVIGKGPRDNDHEFGDEEEVPAELSAGINLDKVADKESFSVIGEEITYTLTVTNTGNVTLNNVVVGDPLTGFEETVATLLPGESQSFNTVYTVTQRDLDNGGVTNVANASANDPQGNTIEDDASEESGASFNRIIANDDNFGVFNRPNSRAFGNILLNDRLNGQNVSPDDVDFEFVDLDGIIGLEIAADGTLSILPGVEAREYTLRYELREKLNPSNMDDAIVTFRIVANEVLPMNDEVTTNQNQEVNIDVLDNDATDFVELDNSSVTVVDGPANGSVTVNPDGTITYVPDTNFSGTDTFTYQVCDVSIPDPICGTAEVTVEVRPLSMSISKTVNVTNATVGEMVTYMISLTNNSIFTVEDIVLSDLLPAEYMMVSSTREPIDGEVTVWSVPSLAPGESISFDIQVMALAEGTAINVATATAGDYTISDEAAAVVIELADIDLSITKSSMGAEIYEGDQFDYQIVVRNEGVADASDVLVTDRLPSNVSFVDATYVSSSDEIIPEMNVNGQNVTWNVPFFPVGGELTITLTVRAEASGNVINEVTVDAAENEIDPDDNTAIDQNVIEPFFIPNVITPGDVDNKNDQFVIKGLDKFEQNEIVIFNRWGDHVYEAKDYQQDWTAEGLNAGSYFYVLTVTDRQGEQHIFKGWIQVIKDGSEFDN